MDTTITLSTIGGIIVAVLLFIILKRVIGLVFRVILAGVLILAVVLGAWWWSSKSEDSNDNKPRPRATQRTRDN